MRTLSILGTTPFLVLCSTLNWHDVETCKLSYVKRISSPGSMHDTGCSGLVHWDDPEGWDGGSGWEAHVHPWWVQVNVWQNQYSVVK